MPSPHPTSDLEAVLDAAAGQTRDVASLPPAFHARHPSGAAAKEQCHSTASLLSLEAGPAPRPLLDPLLELSSRRRIRYIIQTHWFGQSYSCPSLFGSDPSVEESLHLPFGTGDLALGPAVETGLLVDPFPASKGRLRMSFDLQLYAANELHVGLHLQKF